MADNSLLRCRRPVAGQEAWARRRAGTMLAVSGLLVVSLAAPKLLAQEIAVGQTASPAAEASDVEQFEADLSRVLAFERVITRAIARCERSIVSIARVRQSELDERSRPDFQPDPFRQRESLDQPGPTSPDFVPNEFATGVVIGFDQESQTAQVLTNYHVVDAESSHYVTTIDRKVFHARIKAADARADLAVLEISAQYESNRPMQASDFAPIEFGDADKLIKGQSVIGLGNPYAIARDGQVSASLGIVSNLTRKVGPPPRVALSEDDPRTLHDFGAMIQTDARLNLGTSGGALVNLRGQMVGLTTSLAAVAGYEQAAGFAIPVNQAFLRFVEILKQGKEINHGLLGIRPENLDHREVLSGKHGARIGDISPAAPAAHQLQLGDVITHVDGTPIYDADGLRLHVGRLTAGTRALLTIERGNGRTEQRQVELTKFPVTTSPIVTERPPAWRGMRVDYPTAVIGRFANSEHSECLAVSEVDADSPAWNAGLRVGSLITHVNRTPVDRPDDFLREVADQEGPVELSIRPKLGEIRSITVAAGQ